MAELITVSPQRWPPISDTLLPQSTSLAQSILLDAAGETCNFLVDVPRTGSVTTVGFRTAAVTVSDALNISLQTLGADGHPSGTNYGSSTPVVQASVSANTWYEVTLGGAATGATQGDRIAVVIGFNSYVAGNLRIAYLDLANFNFPRTLSYTGGAWANVARIPITILGYGGTYYPMQTVAVSSLTTRGFHSGSTPDESGIYFTPPVAMRVMGLWTNAYQVAAQTFDLVLYDAGNSALMTIGCDTDVGTTNYYPAQYLAATPVVIYPGQYYRVIQKPTTGASALIEPYFTLPSSALREIYPGCAGAQRTSRTDAGSWTTTDTELAFCGVIFDQIEPSVRDLAF